MFPIFHSPYVAPTIMLQFLPSLSFDAVTRQIIAAFSLYVTKYGVSDFSYKNLICA